MTKNENILFVSDQNDNEIFRFRSFISDPKNKVFVFVNQNEITVKTGFLPFFQKKIYQHVFNH